MGSSPDSHLPERHDCEEFFPHRNGSSASPDVAVLVEKFRKAGYKITPDGLVDDGENLRHVPASALQTLQM
ncbi:MAG: hypothetical protein PHO92_03530 [Candidatus Peribacteraceae bacterium]|nr:hypothetical protein [Candidatus Peribacteraceae bacterium]